MQKKTIFVSNDESYNQLFSEIKSELLKVDPVAFTENYLKIDGKPFKVSGNGWRFMADIYRYIALKAIHPDGKPIVILKGRQVGATVMAGALDLYFTASGLFGSRGKSSVSVLHCFPQLSLAQRFSQSKLDSLINSATNDYINQQKLGYNPKTKKVSSNKPDNMTLKQFQGGCNLWVESLGNDGDRIRGMTCDAIFFDECFPYDQYIETSIGKIKIGKLFDLFSSGAELPLIKSFNEKQNTFEYKKILNAWNKGKRELIKVVLGNREVKCTINHKFLTDNGYEYAGKLQPGQLIKASPYTKTGIRSINYDQLQVILGSYLGDGHLQNIGKSRFRLKEIHGLSQEDYCKWKAELFNSECKIIKKNGYSGKPAISFTTKTFGLNLKLPKKKEKCPQWIIDSLDVRGLAIWFMDNGSLKTWENNDGTIGKTITLSTCSFDEDTQTRLVDKLKALGIEAKYKKYDYKNRGQYYSIYINNAASQLFLQLISPYIHPSMKYKSPDATCNYIWNNNYNNFDYCVVDEVININTKENVYDIEVEDNHNFILAPSRNSKNLGGPIVSNCQDMSPTAIGVALKTLVQAKYGPPGTGIQVFFGTPKARGSYFETLWEQTDKRYYFLGCTNQACGHYFMLSTPGTDEWKKIWLFGQTIKCPQCGQEEDKRVLVENGKWMPTEPFDKNGKEKQFVGFHISQLYVPTLDKNYILNQHPENNKASSERIYYNEALGEFYSGSDMPITKEEIYEKCRDPERSFASSISMNERKTWMGVDWGGKVDAENSSAGQSFSCVVVLSADSSGTLNVEFAYRMRSTDFQHKMSFVQEMFKRYNLRLSVADYGYGHDICNELQKLYGNKFISALASGNIKKNVTYDRDMLQLKWNKDYFIEEMFDLMRKGKVRFPWKSFEKIDWLIDHITSMEMEHTMMAGMPKKTYKKGPTPNDGFMALIHAYLAYKFEMSRGFSVNLNNPAQSSIVMPRLAYIPKLK